MLRNTVSDEPVSIPIDGILDLHTFRPGETAELVEEYLVACLERRIKQVRIIHGKGKGVQRKIVHSLLERLDFVSSFQSADETEGGWGATIVILNL
jgi:DNA-nicking Smr family endonuclease